MASTSQLGGETGSQPYAHLLGLLHHKSPGCHNLCTHTGTNWKQHSWVTQFCDPATPGSTSSYKHKTNTRTNIVSLHVQNLLHQVLWISQQHQFWSPRIWPMFSNNHELLLQLGSDSLSFFPKPMRGDCFPNRSFVAIGNCSWPILLLLLLLLQDNWPSVGFALAGGLVLGVGNLLTQYAWPFVGLSIVEVISSSITVVAGWYLIILHKILNIDFNMDVGINQHGIRPAIEVVFLWNWISEHFLLSSRYNNYTCISWDKWWGADEEEAGGLLCVWVQEQLWITSWMIESTMHRFCFPEWDVFWLLCF